ncbi:reverse transcriptase domain-containing protein [Tanacetum coccineum]
MLKAGKLSHLIKELKQNNGKDQAKTAKKGETPGKDKPLAILMVQPWQRVAKQKITQTFSPESVISFPPLGEEDGTEGPIIIEAEMGGHFVHRMYVDRGSSSEILHEHYFNRFRLEVRNQMVPATTPLVGFSGEIIWLIRQISLLAGSKENPGSSVYSSQNAKIPSDRQNGHITEQHDYSTRVHNGLRTRNAAAHNRPSHRRKIQVAIHPEYPEQTIAIGSTLTEEGQKELCGLLRRNLDIFAWKPVDITGVPRHIAEHKLNIREGCLPVRQKKRGQAPERNKAIYEEVEKLVNAGIMKEVHYHSWLSNPVMVKKHDGNWSRGMYQEEREEHVNVENVVPQTWCENNAEEEQKTKATRKRSLVWVHYESFLNPQGEQKSKCQYFAKEYCSDTRIHGTSTLRGHLKTCDKFPGNMIDGQIHLSIQKGDGDDRKMIAWKFDQQSVRRALAYMLIVDELPFKFVEGKGFKHFLNATQPLFHTPSRITMARDCMKLFFEEKKKVGVQLRGNVGRICLTTDTWTSLQRINYTCLTAHYIDNDWVLRKKVLNFFPIFSHRGVDIGKAVEMCLLKWGIESNVFTIIVDNASANDVAVTYLKSNLGHIGKSVDCVRAAVNIHQSNFFSPHSEDRHYRDDLEKTGVPISSDWANVRRLTKFLEHFYQLTLKVSGTLYVTSNNFLDDITSIDTALSNCINGVPDKNLAAMAKMMKCKFDKYYRRLEKCNMATIVASVLDLRNKFEYVEVLLGDVYGKIEGKAMCAMIKASLVELYEDYVRIHASPETHTMFESIDASSSMNKHSETPVIEPSIILKQKVRMEMKRRKSEAILMEDGTEGPMIIEVKMGGHFIHRMYLDGGSSSEILGEIIWPLGHISLLVKIGDEEHSTSTWMNFMVVRSPSPYNGIIGRPGVRRIQAVPSTVYRMLKFPVTGGTITLRSSRIILLECTMVSRPRTRQPVINQVIEEKIKVAIYPEYLEQTIAIGSTLIEEGRTELCGLLRRNLDVFAWKPTDMTGVPRHIAEHMLNIRERCLPIRKKKRGQALERNKAIHKEVEKLVNAGIMKEVHYHSWLSNPVMVKSMTTAGEMCVFQGLEQSMPQRWLFAAGNRLEGRVSLRIPFQIFLGGIQRIPSDKNGKIRRGKDNIHYKPRNILLHENAVQIKKRWSNLSTFGG